MDLDIQPQSTTPLYRQIMDQVRVRVAAGLLRPGDPLPSVREVASRHAINPMTVSKAYSLLRAEGLLDQARGQGMVVAGAAEAGMSPEAGPAPLAERVALLAPVLDQVVSQSRQLALPPDEVLRQLASRLGMAEVLDTAAGKELS